MEEGSLRVDANLSIRRPGDPFGTRTEVKNMNSFSGVERALTAERERQVALVEAGGAVEQCTMTFDAATSTVRPVRSKEESHDYRYFPEPDLPPLVLRPEWLDAQRHALPELPAARRERFQRAFGLTAPEAAVVTASAPVADHFEAVAGLLGDGAGKEAWNWEANDVLAHSEDGESIPARLGPPRIAEVVGLVRGGAVSRQAAKKVLAEMLESDEPAAAIARRLGLVQVQDGGAIERWVREVLEAHPAEVARYRAGETKLLGFFTGQVMKLSKGKADPKAVNAAITAALGA